MILLRAATLYGRVSLDIRTAFVQDVSLYFATNVTHFCLSTVFNKSLYPTMRIFCVRMDAARLPSY